MTRARDVASVATLPSAKGDIYVATAADTPATLPVGANDTVLVADSTTATGLAWKAVAPAVFAGKNKIVNGALGIWQRGTSFTAGGYAADRWRISNGAGNTVSFSQQLFTPATIPTAGSEYQYFARIQRTVSVADTYLLNRQEDARTLTGQTVTLSFWAKSASSFTINPTDIYLYQYFGDGGSGANAVSINTSSVTFGTSWNRYTFTFYNPSIISQTITTRNFFEIAIKLVTAIGNFTLDIWGMQLEAGSIATSFTTATGTIQGELAACQRYYFAIAPAATFEQLGIISAQTTTSATLVGHFPVTMRTAPTALEQSGTANQYAVIFGATVSTCSAVPTYSSFTTADTYVATLTVASGLTAGHGGRAVTDATNGTSAYLAWSAEL